MRKIGIGMEQEVDKRFNRIKNLSLDDILRNFSPDKSFPDRELYNNCSILFERVISNTCKSHSLTQQQKVCLMFTIGAMELSHALEGDDY